MSDGHMQVIELKGLRSCLRTSKENHMNGIAMEVKSIILFLISKSKKRIIEFYLHQIQEWIEQQH